MTGWLRKVMFWVAFVALAAFLWGSVRFADAAPVGLRWTPHSTAGCAETDQEFDAALCAVFPFK